MIYIYIYIVVLLYIIFIFYNKIEGFTNIENYNKKINFLEKKIQRWSLKQNNIISFPRSGQHLLQRTLYKFHTFKNIPFSYCGFYDCCNKIPCAYKSFYQKIMILVENYLLTLN